MQPELQALVHLQSIDGQITATQGELKEIPSRIEAENSCLRDFENTLKNAEADLEALQKRQRNTEGEIQMAEEKLRDTRGKHALVKTNAEYRALTHQIGNHGLIPFQIGLPHEIEAHQTKIGEMEERVLECMEDLEPLRKEVSEAKKGLDDARNKAKASIEKHKDAQARLEDELVKLRRERDTSRKEVSDDLQSRYDVIRKSRGGVAVVPVIDRTCQGCRMSETIQRFFEIRDSKDEIFSCSNCGRIIYYKEPEAVIPVSPADDSD